MYSGNASALSGQVQIAGNFHIHNANLKVPMIIPEGFESASLRCLRENASDPARIDSYFSSWTSLWRFYLKLGMMKNAQEVWDFALEITDSVEKGSAKIHKGTPYYFYAVTLVLGGDIDRGFMMMHAAVEEDKRSFGKGYKNAPAYAFVTLNFEKRDQFFGNWVRSIAESIESVLFDYNQRRAPTLSMSDFRAKFLKDDSLLDVVLLFVYTISKIRHSNQEDIPRIPETDFSSLYEARSMLNLCLILEEVMKNRCKLKNNATFAPCLEKLSKQKRLVLVGETSALNGRFVKNRWKTLEDLLNGNYVLSNGKQVAAQSVECDLAVAYGLRNFAAHSIKQQKWIHDNISSILISLFNSLFFVVASY
jgi:hypothetical protein